MIEIGRLCVKIAGRDAGKKCLIVDIVDENHVLIDGETRRRKCNVNHLELLEQVVKIKKGASHEEIIAEFKRLGLEARVTKKKAKTERPKKVRKKKEKPVEEKKPEAPVKVEKEEAKKEEKVEEKPKVEKK
jgi:large subunit ribosomal protein L14e